MKRLYVLFLLLLIPPALFSQNQKHVVFLTDKDNNPYSLSNPSAFLSQRALERRAMSMIVPDWKDLPVTPSYVSQIAATGAEVIYPLRWFNAVVVKTSDPSVLSAIAALPFVSHVDMVVDHLFDKSSSDGGTQQSSSIAPVEPLQSASVAVSGKSGAFDYGQAYNQAHMIAVDELHNMGYTGAGMVIAVLDAGFYRVDQILAFDSLFTQNRILGTRDFHLPGNNVYGEDMHTHGTSVLSTMGANLPGEMVGTAPHASYWLIRTEVGEYEALVEEYNWAAGAEFADSVGVDIINSSLGYTTFDNPVYDHTYGDMDGKTTPVTRAADIAASRGMLVVNSAGNSGGGSWQYIGAPADGDSVFSIGAVNGQGIYASFSSTGPTSDGRTKPDVTAQGQGTIVVSGWGFPMPGSGTSFSSPVTAGGLACLWQSRPVLTAQQIREAVRNTASMASAPDQLYGWGIPNLVNARLYLNTTSPQPAAKPSFVLLPNPFRNEPCLRNISDKEIDVRIEISASGGKVISYKPLTFTSGETKSLDDLSGQPAGLYLIKLQTREGNALIKAVKL